MVGHREARVVYHDGGLFKCLLVNGLKFLVSVVYHA